MKCAVFECPREATTRFLCEPHYRRHRAGRDLGPRTLVAGLLMGEREVFVCECEDPGPDGIGVCAACGRRVVTFVDEALHARYRAQWPELWARALRRGYEPRGAQ